MPIYLATYVRIDITASMKLVKLCLNKKAISPGNLVLYLKYKKKTINISNYLRLFLFYSYSCHLYLIYPILTVSFVNYLTTLPREL